MLPRKFPCQRPCARGSDTRRRVAPRRAGGLSLHPSPRACASARRALSPDPPPVTPTASTAAGRPLTVGICTRDRPESLLRCLRSLRLAAETIDQVIVVDD